MPNARVGAMPQPPQQHETYHFQQEGGARGRRQQGITMQASPSISIHLNVIVLRQTNLTIRYVLCLLTFRTAVKALIFVYVVCCYWYYNE